jgi:hypothetical protein
VRNHRHTTAVLDVPNRSFCYLATIRPSTSLRGWSRPLRYVSSSRCGRPAAEVIEEAQNSSRDISGSCARKRFFKQHFEFRDCGANFSEDIRGGSLVVTGECPARIAAFIQFLR